MSELLSSLPGFLLAGYLIWLQDRERREHRAAMMQTQARLVALADKAALQVSDAPATVAGKVSVVDDRVMAERDAKATA